VACCQHFLRNFLAAYTSIPITEPGLIPQAFGEKNEGSPTKGDAAAATEFAAAFVCECFLPQNARERRGMVKETAHKQFRENALMQPAVET
jgi:hypothetical protein